MSVPTTKRAMHPPWVWGMLFIAGLIGSMMLSGHAELWGVNLARVNADEWKRTAVAALNMGVFWGFILFVVLFPLLKRRVANPYLAFAVAVGSVGLLALLLSYLLHVGR